MSLLSGFADRVKGMIEEGLGEFKRHTDRATLKSAIGSATRTGWADGSFDSDEKKKAMGVLTKHPAMAHFKQTDITKLWGELDGTYSIDVDMGNDEAMNWVRGAADKPDTVKRVIAMLGCAVAGADNNFDADEVKAVAEIAGALGVQASSLSPLVTAAEANEVSI